MSELETLGLTVLAWLLLALTAGLVCLALWRLLPPGARQLLPWPRPQPTPWSGVDVWMAFAILILIPGFCATLLDNSELFPHLYGERARTDAYRERRELWVGLVAGPLGLTGILGWFTLARGVSPGQLGLTGRRAAQGAVAGYLGWLVLSPVALLLYGLVQIFVDPERHMVDRLSRLSLLEVEWVAITFLALVGAPILEELLFRGVLLRWQLSRLLDAQVVVGAAALVMAVLGGARKESFNPSPMLFVLAMLPGYALLPYLVERFRKRRKGASTRGTGRETLPEELAWVRVETAPWQVRLAQGLARFARLASDKRTNVWLALYGNGLLFAAFHSGVWPSPVPLFLLGFGLAWLAYRTQSLVASTVAHVLFNGVATLTLFLTEALRSGATG